MGALVENSNTSNHAESDFFDRIETASYPTRSLEFLQELEGGASARHHEQSQVKLNIIIVGAGLGGLATAIALARKGHNLTVFEQAPELGEVGAGIQIPPNSSKHLISWGIEPFMLDHVIEPSSIKIKRWQTGELIGLTKLVPDFRIKFDAPYWVVHRAHFHNALHQLALSHGVEVRTNSKVNGYDADAGSIELEDGSIHTADLVIAADGVKSAARVLILDGDDKPPKRMGFAAYRATVDTTLMKADSDTAKLLENPGQNLWVGNMRHVMSYTISGGRAFNMVLSHPDKSDPSTWDQEKALKDMREQFAGWDPTLTKVIQMVKSTFKWPLLSGSKLDRYVHPSGKLIILGDAAHAMLPYMSQGAAMAVEDGAALAAALGFASSPSDVMQALKLWESVRIERSGQMQEASLVNGKLWHFPDGPLQRARDEGMNAEVDGQPYDRSSNQWSDPVTSRWAYGYDAVDAVSLVGRVMGLGKVDSGPNGTKTNGHHIPT